MMVIEKLWRFLKHDSLLWRIPKLLVEVTV